MDETGATGRSVFYSAQDGLKLHARVHGTAHPERLPVVCLAGLTRNARDFDALAAILAGDPERPRQVIAFDYRGRGRSDRDPDWRNYEVLVETSDIIAGLAVLGIEHAAFIGTSRGGLIIHALAAMRPALMKAAVLNDIGPVVEGAGLAQIKAYLERAPRPKSIAEAVAIQKATSAAGFPALDDTDWERMVRSYYREDDGRLVPDFDPALLRSVTGLDLGKPLPVFWPQFMGLAGIPVLAIRGRNSSLLSAATLAEMERRHPALEAVTVEGQGHAPLLETGELPKRIAAFLAKADRTLH
ncbi:MAG: alpha/beta hydrolase [Rhizobiaceae bacterium]|nr:alpha/beta hydrolase [Rhizobiaceae bacterium]MCV0408044.1 alpha/beta hydrolase [Rhizobiaceae bacterium]